MENLQVLFILFGATGDLASRKLYPAIFNLFKKGKLSSQFALIGTGRREWSNEYFREVVSDSVAGLGEEDLIQEFSEHFYYKSHDVNVSDQYDDLETLAKELENKYQIEGNRLFYLSMAPSLFGVITKNLSDKGLVDTEGFSRVVFEKPFGFNQESARQLDQEIAVSFDKEQIFRIDHYLGKEMIQNIIALRFSNPLFKNLWNHEFISNIQITVNEDMSVGERGGYYDSNGALKDMVQNHIMQLFSILAMEEPASYDTKDVAQAKNSVLKDLKTLTTDNIHQNVVRAQYVANNESETSYRDENKVDSESTTETYVAGKFELDNDRWQGVPFYYRTGKNLDAKVTRIDIVFKDTEKMIFDKDQINSNVLTIEIDPLSRITLSINEKEIGHEMNIVPIGLTNERSKEQKDQTPEAYEKLMLDSLKGIQKYFVQIDEVIESWKYIDKISELWSQNSEDLTTYQIGSNGPDKAAQLLEQNRHQWIYTGK